MPDVTRVTDFMEVSRVVPDPTINTLHYWGEPIILPPMIMDRTEEIIELERSINENMRRVRAYTNKKILESMFGPYTSNPYPAHLFRLTLTFREVS